MSNLITSTPSSPATLHRQIGVLDIELNAAGLMIQGLPRGPVALTVAESLALFDFVRTAGARQLVNRAWLAEQHAAALSAVE